MEGALARGAGRDRASRVVNVALRPGEHTTIDAARSSPPVQARAAAGILMIIFVLQSGIGVMRDSVTIDEFVGLPVGLYTLQAVDFRSESMNPPFFRSFAALPLLLLGGPLAPRIPPMNEVNDWAMGYEFMASYADSYHELFVPARCMVILTAALLGALVLEWATRLYGWQSGLVALLLFTFSPSILAHSHFVTLDVSGAVGWTGVAFLTWRLLDKSSLSSAVLLGLVLGMAPTLKLSGLVLPIVVVVLVAACAVREPARLGRLFALLLLAFVIALLTLNGLYRFEGFAMPFADIPFDSGKLRAVRTALPWLRLPVPKPFLMSLDVLFVGDQPQEPLYYLGGMWSKEGWWYYHLLAFALKTPLPLLIGGAAATVVWIGGRSGGRRDYCVFLTLIAVFAANSLLNPLNIGVRHALPAIPLLTIAASRWFAAPLGSWMSAPRRSAFAPAALRAVLLGWFVLGGVQLAPRYLQYFNELAGGADNGHNWLIDSNMDWGQDLVRLSEYMHENNLKKVSLAYFGRVDPRVYGIEFQPLVEGMSHGPAVVSASFLVGRPYWVWFGPGDLQWAPGGYYSWVGKFPEIDRVGSMFVFNLP